MRLHRLVDTFDDRADRCRSQSELGELLSETLPDLGFEWFSLIQPLWFQTPHPRLIKIDNYGDFGEQFVARKYYLNDPVIIASQRASRAFPWGRLATLTALGHRQQDVLEEGRRRGISNGITLPINVIGEPFGLCSFATTSGLLPSRWHCRAAVIIGASAFHEARRICNYPARGTELPVLSARKLDVLHCAALGKSDPEIAMILGLSRATIETYMKQLRIALNACSRTQLCVMALRLGLIAF
ncbi:helix-turn-helix transcriptional regulator [Novosphingobium rosa]|uniref:helix-turn-helix transcriptional regulator n=1 Tax=Novosphingobium rosa TaxID=76978 RepID=UPI000834CF37|nr:LuxR family transcriptional regulator [Novosphingobium rosa]